MKRGMSFLLPEETRDGIKQLAREWDCTQGAVIERLVRKAAATDPPGFVDGFPAELASSTLWQRISQHARIGRSHDQVLLNNGAGYSDGTATIYNVIVPTTNSTWTFLTTVTDDLPPDEHLIMVDFAAEQVVKEAIRAGTPLAGFVNALRDTDRIDYLKRKVETEG